jgi:hypothetical protein
MGDCHGQLENYTMKCLSIQFFLSRNLKEEAVLGSRRTWEDNITFWRSRI